MVSLRGRVVGGSSRLGTCAVHRLGPRRLRTVSGDCSFPFTGLRRRVRRRKELPSYHWCRLVLLDLWSASAAVLVFAVLVSAMAP